MNDAVNYATAKGTDPYLRKNFRSANICDWLCHLGTLVVACAGNLFFDGNIPSLPGAANNSFAVTNLQIDANGVYSRNPISNTGDYVDIAAPGK